MWFNWLQKRLHYLVGPYRLPHVHLCLARAALVKMQQHQGKGGMVSAIAPWALGWRCAQKQGGHASDARPGALQVRKSMARVKLVLTERALAHPDPAVTVAMKQMING